MSFDPSPYQPPAYHPSRQSQPRVPAVWKWYVAYCVAMALLYLACMAGGVAMFAFAEEMATEDPRRSPAEARITGIMLIVISVPLLLLYGLGPLIPKGKAAWILGIINIAIGMTSACCLPASIPLLIFWMKPELKAYLRVP